MTKWFTFKISVTGRDRYDAYDKIVHNVPGGVNATFVSKKIVRNKK
jgi:hypothetical protein